MIIFIVCLILCLLFLLFRDVKCFIEEELNYCDEELDYVVTYINNIRVNIFTVEEGFVNILANLEKIIHSKLSEQAKIYFIKKCISLITPLLYEKGYDTKEKIIQFFFQICEEHNIDLDLNKFINFINVEVNRWEKLK